MALTLGSSINQALNYNSLSSTPVFPLPFLASKISIPSYSSSTNTARHGLKLKHLPRTSSQDVPLELSEEDSKFVPLGAEDLQYGPPALLVLGFELEEIPKIQQFLKDIDGEFIQVVCCTEDMINLSLWDAISTDQPNLQEVKIAKSLPRICFLSGLSGEEMMMFIDSFPEIGLEPAVFAALVPNSADKPVAELIEEIMADHEMLTAKNVSSPEPLPN